MVRVQVRLPEDQVERIRVIAAERGVSMSELIRRAVALFLNTEGYSSWEERKRRALEAVGRYASGESWVSATTTAAWRMRMRGPSDLRFRNRAVVCRPGYSYGHPPLRTPRAGGELRGLLERWYPWGSISS